MCVMRYLACYAIGRGEGGVQPVSQAPVVEVSGGLQGGGVVVEVGRRLEHPVHVPLVTVPDTTTFGGHHRHTDREEGESEAKSKVL